MSLMNMLYLVPQAQLWNELSFMIPKPNARYAPDWFEVHSVLHGNLIFDEKMNIDSNIILDYNANKNYRLPTNNDKINNDNINNEDLNNENINNENITSSNKYLNNENIEFEKWRPPLTFYTKEFFLSEVITPISRHPEYWWVKRKIHYCLKNYINGIQTQMHTYDVETLQMLKKLVFSY